MARTSIKWPAAYDMAYSPDGRLLACVGRNVVVIDVEARQRIATIHPISHPSSVAFSPDGNVLAVKSTSGRIVLIDPNSGEVLFDHLNQKEGEGSAVRFSPDGDQLVDGSWNGGVTVRSAFEKTILLQHRYPGERIGRVTHDQTGRTWLIEHSPKASAGKQMPEPGYVSVWSWPLSQGYARKFGFGIHFESATISPDGRFFCFIQKWDPRRLRIARIDDGAIIASSRPIEAGGTGSALAWSSDCKFVGVVTNDRFEFYRATDLAFVGQRECQYPSSLAFAPDQTTAMLGTWKKTIPTTLADILQEEVASKPTDVALTVGSGLRTVIDRIFRAGRRQ